MGYNWRQVVWHPTEKVIYGVHGNSGYLFRFDPRAPRVEVLERLTSLPSKRSGMFDQFSYGYLGFTLGPDGRTLYYLTGGPIYVDGKRVTGKDSTGKGEAKGLEDLHLVTYDIPTGQVHRSRRDLPARTASGRCTSIRSPSARTEPCTRSAGSPGRPYADRPDPHSRQVHYSEPVTGRCRETNNLLRQCLLFAGGLRVLAAQDAKPAGQGDRSDQSAGDSHHELRQVPGRRLDAFAVARHALRVPERARARPGGGRREAAGRAPSAAAGACAATPTWAEASSVDELAAQLAVCEKMGVKYMFLSPKHTGVSKEVAYERLRRVGDIAKKHGVTIVLETHPDLGTNADAHLETMRQINHPNVRVNFDTGNITFYNKGTDAVTELKKIIDYVATVELKDHNGQYKAWNFPVLGKGVVDFPAILKVLEEHHFRGPITMEVEGVQGVEMDEAQTKQYIAESVTYIQSLGNFRLVGIELPRHCKEISWSISESPPTTY